MSLNIVHGTGVTFSNVFHLLCNDSYTSFNGILSYIDTMSKETIMSSDRSLILSIIDFSSKEFLILYLLGISALVRMLLMYLHILYAGLFMALMITLVPGLCTFGVPRCRGACDVNVRSCFFVFILMYFFPIFFVQCCCFLFAWNHMLGYTLFRHRNLFPVHCSNPFCTCDYGNISFVCFGDNYIRIFS